MCKYKFILFQTLSFLDLTLEAYRPESDWKSPENPFSCLASAWIANGNSRAHISHPEKCYSPSRFILHLKWQRGTLGKRKLSQTDFSFPSSCLEGRVGGLVIQWHVHLPSARSSHITNISRSQRLLCWLHIRCIIYIGWKWKQHWIFAFPDKWIYWGSTS